MRKPEPNGSESKYNRCFMDAAAAQAEIGLTAGHGGPFGAVVVLNNERIVGRGHNRVLINQDPTAHAEIMAIRSACSELGRFELHDCVLYTSCEPCPMCLGAVYWARLAATFYACQREDAASAGFDDAFIYDEINLDPQQRQRRFQQQPHEPSMTAMRRWQQRPGTRY